MRTRNTNCFAALSVAATLTAAPIFLSQAHLLAATYDPITPRNGIVVFPDGSAVPIVYRSRPPLVGPVNDLSAAEHLERYRPAALAGDGPAAFILHWTLRDCARAYTEEVDLEEAVTHLRQSSELRTADTQDSQKISDPADIPMLEEAALRHPYEHCQGITSDQKAEASQWLKRSADAGYHWAMIERARLLGRTPEAAALWKKAWDDGYVRALGWLAEFHREDRTLSYAYFLLKVRLLEGVAGQSPELQRRTRLTRELAELERRGGEVAPEEMRAATQIAKDLLSQNQRCCYLP